MLLQEQTPGLRSAEFELQRFDWLLTLVCLFDLNIQSGLNLSELLPLQRRHCPLTVSLVQLVGQQHQHHAITSLVLEGGAIVGVIRRRRVFGQSALRVLHGVAHLYRIHPASDGGEGGDVSEVVHGQDALSFAVVLFRDAAEPDRREKK